MTPEDTAGIYADFDRVYKTMQADGFTGKLYK